MNAKIQALEKQIGELSQELIKLRAESVEMEGIPNYSFNTLTGEVTLRDLFNGKDTLFAIHNMGQGCRYCTLWADGLNGFLPHLEDRFSVVLLSKDSPELQQRFAHSRHWRFRMASHGGGKYIQEQTVLTGQENMPGIVCYSIKENKIVRKNSAVFGPGDLFCSIWHVLALGGFNESNWVPQYSYWQKPALNQMEDGGQNLL
ncbi:MAG: DUF899 family protein [FCB group bacterium]|nr:DUF899 family protein [FCB group bacterium]